MLRYGLVGVIGWIGLMKFTRVEASALDHAAGHPAAFIDETGDGR